jgi:dihydroorotate dehydrogenase (NAD+) catalytic subunit
VSNALKVSLGGVEFANPIMTASGCCGYGEELSEMFPLSKLGALVTKSITLEPRLGHPPPRTAETTSGMLNAIGLANVGVDAFIRDKIPFLSKQKTRVIVNVAGASIDEYVEVSRRLNNVDDLDMIELNISCPNVDRGGIQFGSDPYLTQKVVAEIRKVFARPLIVKLSPNVTNIGDIARAAEAGGADVLTVMNTLIGTAVDIETRRPRLTNNKGGLSGPAIKPIALAMVVAVHEACRLPIIGVGGIATWQDVVEFILCGASAVQIGTALFVDPEAPIKIADGLKTYLQTQKIKSINDLVGKLEKY